MGDFLREPIVSRHKKVIAYRYQGLATADYSSFRHESIVTICNMPEKGSDYFNWPAPFVVDARDLSIDDVSMLLHYKQKVLLPYQHRSAYEAAVVSVDIDELQKVDILTNKNQLVYVSGVESFKDFVKLNKMPDNYICSAKFLVGQAHYGGINSDGLVESLSQCVSVILDVNSTTKSIEEFITENIELSSLIMSAATGVSDFPITTVEKSIEVIGRKRCLSLAFLHILTKNSKIDKYIISELLIKAYQCMYLAKQYDVDETKAYLTGLLVLLPKILDKRLERFLRIMQLEEDVILAIASGYGDLGKMLDGAQDESNEEYKQSVRVSHGILAQFI